MPPDSLAAALPPDTLSADSLASAVAEGVARAVPAAARVEAIAEAAAREATDEAAREAARVAVAKVPVTDASGRVPEVWTRLVDALHGVTGLGQQTVSNLLATLLLVGVLWGLRQVALAVVRRRNPTPRALYSWRKTTTYVAVALGLVVGLRIWLGALGSFGTFLGLLTAGIAIALRDPLVNIAGWLFILWKRPFAPGDRVTVRTHTGDVVDQRLFQFTLLEVGTATGAGQSTGRLVHVPNGWVFTDSVINATGAFAYVWHEIALTVTFESNWRAAKALLAEIATSHADALSPDAERVIRQAAREHFIFYSKLTPVVYTNVVDQGVQLTLRYLVAPRRIRGSEETLWEAILDALAARGDIAIAYRTSRILRANEEGRIGGSVLGDSLSSDPPLGDG